MPERDRAPGRGDEELQVEAGPIRPYALTGGRTRSAGDQLAIEALVSAVQLPTIRLTSEKTRIVDLVVSRYLSIAELSAHLHLPVGVIRVLVGDLREDGLVLVHAASSQYTPAATFSVLESVLDGISTL